MASKLNCIPASRIDVVDSFVAGCFATGVLKPSGWSASGKLCAPGFPGISSALPSRLMDLFLESLLFAIQDHLVESVG
jgi:hypothetical protein